MLFRFLIAASYLLTLANLSDVLAIERFNPVEKSLFVIAALAFVLTRPKSWVILALMIICLILVTALGTLTTYPDFQWSILAGGLNQILVPYLLMAGRPDQKDKVFLSVLISWLPSICSLLGLFYSSLHLHEAFGIEFNSGAMRFGGSLIPAFLAGLCLSGILTTFKLVESGRRGYILVLLLNFVILILTGGRTASALAIVLIAGLVFLSRQFSRHAKFVCGIFGGTVAAVSAPIVLALYGDRIFASGLNGREVIWNWLWDMSSDYPNYGIGFAHQWWATPLNIIWQTATAAAHNDYLRLLVELGWFGAIAFYLLFVAAALLAWKRSFPPVDYTVPLALTCYMMLSITDNALADPTNFTIIVAAIMATGLRENVASSTQLMQSKRLIPGSFITAD